MSGSELVGLADRLRAEAGRRVMQSNPDSMLYYDDVRRNLLIEAADALAARLPGDWVMVPRELLTEASEALDWWHEQHSCCSRDDELIARIDAAIAAASPTASPEAGDPPA